MVTTRRSFNDTNESYAERAGGIGILERETPASFNEYKNPEPVREESMDEAKSRMQRNLEKLMNYDRFSEVNSSNVIVEEPENQVVDSVTVEDDAKPTSTTMQFGTEEVDQMYNEMKHTDDDRQSYRLNGRGKLLAVLYALTVTVVLALIIINTGVLATIKGAAAEKQVELNRLVTETTELQERVSDISSDGYVIEKAEEIGMISK